MEKIKFVLFFTKPQKVKANTRKKLLFIDFDNTKKIELSCRRREKKQSFVIFTKPKNKRSSLIHAKKKNSIVFHQIIKTQI